jgi:hypothetical protein
MHVQRIRSKRGDKVYEQVLLRESYREPGAPRSAVKKRTLLNLTKYPTHEVEAIELALKHKNNIPELERILDQQISQKQGRSVGAVWLLNRLAHDIGLPEALGHSQEALLCLWLVFARLIDQGSRLSAVRLAQEHAAVEILDLSDVGEKNLSHALHWLADNQDEIEKKLFDHKYSQEKPRLFLYDVTSSYLEGDQNEPGEWGYNRDKKQVVIGLLCDGDGDPISIKVFKGNTADIKTFADRIEKTASQFGCGKLTMVGDWDMIKGGQIEDLANVGVDCITATKKVWEKEGRLKPGDFLTITCPGRPIEIDVDEDYPAEVAKLDGGYCLKTDLKAEDASKETIHDRYKDLDEVGSAFRICKTGHPELRPICMRKEERTRGHAFVVMLAYLLRRKLAAAWRDFDITVEEGLRQLTTLCAIEKNIADQAVILTVPAPRDSLDRLFTALGIVPPTTLPHRTAHADTKQQRQKRRT